MNEVWIVMYSDYVDDEKILGAFASEENAELFIGRYALKNEIHSEYLYVFKKKVEVLNK